MKRRRQSRLVVFDSNGVNPYGVELCGVLSTSMDCVLVCPADAITEGLTGSRIRPYLTPTRSGQSTRLREVLEIFCVILMVLSGRTIVIVWARTYQRFIFGLLGSILRNSVVYIDHNVGSGRDSRGWRNWSERLLRATSRVVVHGVELARRANESGVPRVRVVPHPPFDLWVARTGVRATRTRRTERVTFLLLGASRGDKWGDAGLQRLLSGFAEIPSAELVLCVRPRVTADLPMNVLDLSRDEVIPDSVLAEGLIRSDVLLAPYVNPTESGTIHLALSSGLDVVAFEGGMLREYLPAAMLVPPDWEKFFSRVRELTAGPYRRLEFRDSRGEACRTAWTAIV